MAFAQPHLTLKEEDSVSLVRQLGLLISSSIDDKVVRRAGLAEALAIWLLEPEHFIAEPPSLPVGPSAFWHLQVYLNKKPAAHAVVQAESQLQIRELAISPLAKRINKAMKWIDKHDKDNTPVLFLVVPSCLVYAFHLVRSDLIFVIQASMRPAHLPDEVKLRRSMILSTGEFLGRLKYLYEAIQPKR